MENPPRHNTTWKKKSKLQDDRSNTVFIFLIKNQYNIVSMDTHRPYFIESKEPYIDHKMHHYFMYYQKSKTKNTVN